MSKNSNENNESLISVLLNTAKVPSEYVDYAEATVGKVLDQRVKGDTYWIADPNEPLHELYYTVVQNHTMDEEAKAISRIADEFDGIKINNKKIDEDKLLLYRLYELNKGENINVNDIGTPHFDKITKDLKFLKGVAAVGEGLGYAYTVYKISIIQTKFTH